MQKMHEVCVSGRRDTWNIKEYAEQAMCPGDKSYGIIYSIWAYEKFFITDADIKGRHPYGLYKNTKSPKQVYVQTDGAMVPICGEKAVIYKENKLGIVYKDTDIVRKISKTGKERIEIKNKHYVSSLGGRDW